MNSLADTVEIVPEDRLRADLYNFIGWVSDTPYTDPKEDRPSDVVALLVIARCELLTVKKYASITASKIFRDR